MAEIGFGKIGQHRRAQRLLNKDGSFNVEKLGVPFLKSLTLYDALMSVTWPKFILLLGTTYILSNLLFALLFMACGPGALNGLDDSVGISRFWECFFFSVQTFATIGYGVIHPTNMAANVLVTAESLVGLLQLGIFTGILFARFSRPQARVLFSTKALVAPFKGGKSFQFRLTNLRGSALLEPSAKVLFSRLVGGAGEERREYSNLPLSVPQIVFLPLHWTVVHPIDEKSPLFGLTQKDLCACEAEFLILFSAIDEMFSESVYIRHSYRFDEVVYDAQFAPLFVETASGKPAIDVRKLSSFVPV